jgi:hypothetical protein
MATRLTKSVTRVVEDWGGTGREGKRSLSITLNPAGFITFRLKSCQQEYDLDFSSAFSLAMKRWAMKKMVQDQKDREARRTGLAE